MIFDTPSLPLPLTLHADLCVVGSGAGGMMAAMIAAEAGMRVVVLEAGELMTPAQMSQREEEMFPRLFWESGARTTADRGVKIHQGKGVGGSTLHNINLCKRIPEPISELWQREHRLAALSSDVWQSLYREVEELLAVSVVPEGMRNRHNRLLQQACDALGWRGGNLLHNRTGCIGSGFCELGCAFDSKNNAAKVALPRVVKAGADVLAGCQAVRLLHDGRRVRGVKAVAVRPITHEPMGEVEVLAPRVCVSASATGTAALLLRSEVPDVSGTTGEGLRVHPAVLAAGDFDESIVAWQGVPQSYECTELLQLGAADGPRLWIIPAFAHPMGVATMLPGHGEAHAQVMQRLPNMAVFSAMLHDHTAGSVQPQGDMGLSIDYWPDAADRQQLSLGLWACVHLLMAAGARRVLVPTFPEPLVILRGQSYEHLRSFEIERGKLDITAVHPMATVPMDDDPRRGAVDSRGRHHGVAGLWVADGSLFPTSIGGPPQLSIYALGLHVGRAIAAASG